MLLWVTVATTALLQASPRALAQDATPVPGQYEFYVGSVSQFLGFGGPPAADAVPRLGVARLEVGDGLLSGRFIFPGDDSGAVEVRAECSGSIDLVTGRGLLKVRWVDPDAPPDAAPVHSEKISVLLKRGVLTGGTMGPDGGVLAFRLERAFVILP